jgi:hypothetical protein
MAAIYTINGTEAMGPPVDPSQPTTPPDVQQQIADVWDFLFNPPAADQTPDPATAAAPASSGGFLDWLKAHETAVIAAGLGFFALAIFAPRR